jgi:hypothetical protein
MSYPILTASKALAAAIKIQSALDSGRKPEDLFTRGFGDLEAEVELRSGADVDVDSIYRLCGEQFRYMSEDRKAGKLNKLTYEEAMAEFLFELTSDIPSIALQDPDFWRWLGVLPLRRYINELEGDFKPSRVGGEGNRNNIRWTLVRTYQWGYKCAGEGNDRFSGIRAYRLAKEEAAGSDGWTREFYISQIVRRRWGSGPRDYRKFIEVTVAAPALLDYSNEVRPTQSLGSAVSRVTENLYLPALDDDELAGLITQEKGKIASNRRFA